MPVKRWIWNLEYGPKAVLDKETLDFEMQMKIHNYLMIVVLLAESPKQYGNSFRYNDTELWRYKVDSFDVVCDLLEKKHIVRVVGITDGAFLTKN